MIKHFFSVIIFIFIFLFIFFISSTYVSNSNKERININRSDAQLKIERNISSLPFLKNDTSDVVEFNSGYEDDNNRIKRKFWDLFKKND
tara:strand:+ start:47 stop:313 length:267 start_codon:yes stop_codon:yes gene_type:complete